MIGVNFKITQFAEGKAHIDPAPYIQGQTPLEVEILDDTIKHLGQPGCRVLAGLIAARGLLPPPSPKPKP